MTRLSKALNYKRSKDISQRPYTWIEYNIVFESDCLCLSIFLFSPWSPVTHDHYYSIIATALDLYLKIIFTLRSEEMKIIVNCWIYLHTEVDRRIGYKNHSLLLCFEKRNLYFTTTRRPPYTHSDRQSPPPLTVASLVFVPAQRCCLETRGFSSHWRSAPPARPTSLWDEEPPDSLADPPVPRCGGQGNSCHTWNRSQRSWSGSSRCSATTSGSFEDLFSHQVRTCPP